MDRQKLIEDTIEVKEINKDGPTFDRGKSNGIRKAYQLHHLFGLVSRIGAKSQVNRLEIELDVNSEIYPMAAGEFYKMVLASSVNADGSDNFDIIQYENAGSATTESVCLECKVPFKHSATEGSTPKAD